MCRLSCHLAARCRHPIRYQYDHCAKAPYPNRCPELVDSVDATTLDDNKPFCDPCYKRMQMDMTDQFRRERLRLTAKARVENHSADEISEMRKALMIEHYEKLKRAGKPLPAIPTADSEVSPLRTDVKTSVDVNEYEAAEIRAELKDWNWRKLDYLHKPFPVEPLIVFSDEDDEGVWLERDDSGIQLRYVNAPRYGDSRMNRSG